MPNASFVPLKGLPGQCKDISPSEVTKNSCKISWEPPESDGGSPILHYVLERREAQKKTFLPVMSRDNVLSFVVKDLMLNGEYYFRVKAVNKIGSGEFLEIRNPVITEEQKRKYNLFICQIIIYYILCTILFSIIIINYRTPRPTS